jgi:mannosyltransferase
VAATAGLRLTMVGGGAPDQDEQRLLERRLPGRHVWAGAVSRPALGRMLEAAHALVYCSSTEGFGIPLLEAQAQGCPVVCSDIPVFREVAGAGARYVRDADAAAYAAALEDLKQPQLREELTEAGRVNAARFSWQRSMRLHAELLDALGGRTG